MRETELETARTVLFWADDHPGFRWKGEGDLRTKAEEAILLMLTMAIPMSKEGERIGSLGSGRRPSFGRRAVDRLATDLLRGTGGHFPAPPRAAATLLVASDFYDPIPEWSARFPACREMPGRRADRGVSACGSGLPVSRPHEILPPRRSHRPHPRAETMREEYRERFLAQRDALQKLARQMGWAMFGTSPAPRHWKAPRA